LNAKLLSGVAHGSRHAMIRTFFDSGVLIVGAKGIHAERAKALDMLRDPGRQFLTSQFLH
jgi:hypothetical protein